MYAPVTMNESTSNHFFHNFGLEGVIVGKAWVDLRLLFIKRLSKPVHLSIRLFHIVLIVYVAEVKMPTMPHTIILHILQCPLLKSLFLHLKVQFLRCNLFPIGLCYRATLVIYLSHKKMNKTSLLL